VPDTVSSSRLSTAHLILIPAVITLAITILRLVGELERWSKVWFNPEQGGFLAVVGIVWLAPVFGIYFALKLSGAGQGPPSAGRAAGYAALGFLVLALGFYLFQHVMRSLAGILVMWTLAAAGAALQFPAWRALFRVLIAYAYAARIPVAIVMFFATRANWESHYNAAEPGNSPLESYVLFGFFPQLVWWVSFTIIAGALFGSIAVALVNRRKAERQIAA
jgi:hypothetical protein